MDAKKKKIQKRDIYPIRRLKNEKEIDPDNVILFLNASATMALNPTCYLLKTISKIQNHSINYFKRRSMQH